MIDKNLFQKLSSRKKIYKIAEAIRKLELNAIDDKKNNIDLSELINYKNFLEELLLDNKLKIANNLLKEFLNKNNENKKILRKDLNELFHNLLKLINIEIKEQDYIEKKIKLFDNNENLNTNFFDVSIILDNLRSPFNVGSIFRTSECFKIKEMILCGITPTPEINKKVEKTSKGTNNSIKWSYYKNTVDIVKILKDNNKKIYAVETLEGGKNITNFIPHNEMYIIFGNEEFGIDDEIIPYCDDFIYIPIYGKKNSLNVACAFSIVIYEIIRKQIVKNL